MGDFGNQSGGAQTHSKVGGAALTYAKKGGAAPLAPRDIYANVKAKVQESAP